MQFGTALIPLTTDPFSNIFNIYNIYSYTEVIHFNQNSLMFVVLCEDQKLVYESFFTFALMWALGGAVADAWKLRNSELFRHRDMSDMPRNAVTCTEDKIVNHRRAFSSFLRR